MSIMDELLNESSESSLTYRRESPVKKVCLSIASRGRGSYIGLEDSSEKEEAVYSLIDVLSEESSNLRNVTGMDITLQLDPEDTNRNGYTVHVDIPKKGNTPSAIYGNLSDSKIEEIIKSEKIDSVLGTLDYEKRTVSGYFSTLEFTINVGTALFDSSLLNEDELAAVLLHEIGHIWDFIEGFGEMNRSAAIASYTKKVLNGNYSIDKKLDIVRSLDNDLGSSVTDPDEVQDEELATLVAANAFAKKNVASKIKTYEKHSAEFVADDFATQNGLGYPLATAMAKLEKRKFFLLRDSQYRPTWTGYMGMFSDLPSAIEIGRYLAIGGGNPFVTTLVMSVVTGLIPSHRKLRPRDRLEKVRQGMISALRDPNVSPTDKRYITKDLEALDKEIKGLRYEGFSVMGWLSDSVKFFFTSQNKRFAKTRMTLDSIDNNRLFEMAERLRQSNKTK